MPLIVAFVALLIYLALVWLTVAITIAIAKEVAPGAGYTIVRKIAIVLGGVLSLVLLLMFALGALPVPHTIVAYR